MEGIIIIVAADITIKIIWGYKDAYFINKTLSKLENSINEYPHLISKVLFGISPFVICSKNSTTPLNHWYNYQGDVISLNLCDRKSLVKPLIFTIKEIETSYSKEIPLNFLLAHISFSLILTTVSADIIYNGKNRLYQIWKTLYKTLDQHNNLVNTKYNFMISCMGTYHFIENFDDKVIDFSINNNEMMSNFEQVIPTFIQEEFKKRGEHMKAMEVIEMVKAHYYSSKEV